MAVALRDPAIRRLFDSLCLETLEMCTVVRLQNGYYKYGRKILKYSRVQRLAWKRGHRWVHIVEDVTGTHVDTLELTA